MPSSRYRNPTVKPSWYAARQRSMTRNQKRIEAALWPLLGLTYTHEQPISLDAAFGSATRPRVLEVGCGCGEALVAMAAARPTHDFVGVDWMRRGLATCLAETDRRGLSGNVRLVRSDAATLLERGFAAAPTFDEAHFFFPDPWRGSLERRVLRPDVVADLSARMRPCGCLRVATDVRGYPEQIREAVATCGASWEEVACEALEAQRGPGFVRPSTRYAREAAEAGRDVEELCFVFGGASAGDGEPS